MNEKRRSADNDALSRLIQSHAPHGFNGVMRSLYDGCPVYVAAVELAEALRQADCIPPGPTGGA